MHRQAFYLTAQSLIYESAIEPLRQLGTEKLYDRWTHSVSAALTASIARSAGLCRKVITETLIMTEEACVITPTAFYHSAVINYHSSTLGFIPLFITYLYIQEK